MDRNDGITLSSLSLLTAYGLRYRVHDVEVPDLAPVGRNAWEDEAPHLLIVHGESLIQIGLVPLRLKNVDAIGVVLLHALAKRYVK